MDQFIRFDINFYSIILLLIMLGITRIKKDIFSFSSSIFLSILIVNILGSLLEPITWFIDGQAGSTFYFLGYAVNTIFILCAPVIVGLWASYLDYKLFSDKRRIQKRLFYQHSTFAILILLMVNYYYPVLFTIEQGTNNYIYGSLSILRFILVYPVYLYFVYLVIKNRKRASSNIITGIMIFLLVPTSGSMIQLFFPEILFTWSSLALSVLVIYIFLETISGNVDYLTKLYSRRLLQDYIKSLIENHEPFHVIMMDMDKFKEVNDTYGHQVGDLVLIAFADVLKSTFKNRKSFAARLGGDEFLIVLKKNIEDSPEHYIELVKARAKDHEFLSKFPFLCFSSGYLQFDGQMTIDELLTTADQKMYADKASHEKVNQINS
jgi:diguanylate cyclase (GGDEF)-like protein